MARTPVTWRYAKLLYAFMAVLCTDYLCQVLGTSRDPYHVIARMDYVADATLIAQAAVGLTLREVAA